MPAAQYRILHEIVGEANARREVVVMRVEKLRPTLAPGAISAENISTQQVAGAWIRYRGIHVRKPAQRIGRWRFDLIAESQIQSEFRREFISIVDKQAIVFVTSAGKVITELKVSSVYHSAQPPSH